MIEKPVLEEICFYTPKDGGCKIFYALFFYVTNALHTALTGNQNKDTG